MKILITGVSGFIGKQLVPYLLNNKHEISVLVKSKEKIRHELWLDKVIVYEGDITEYTQLERCCREQRTVIHLAAISETSINDKNIYQHINVEGTKNLYNACVEANVEYFLYLSSTKVSEKELLDYAQSKFEAEQFLLKASTLNDTKICGLRPGIVYGPGMKGSINSWISSITRSKAPPIPPVHSALSMISVEDLCKAIHTCLETENVWGNIYEINDGIPYQVKDIENKIKISLGKKPGSIYFPLWCFQIASFLGEISNKYAKFNIGFSKNSYNALFKNRYRTNALFCEHTGYSPTHTFYEELPKILSFLNNYD